MSSIQLTRLCLILIDAVAANHQRDEYPPDRRIVSYLYRGSIPEELAVSFALDLGQIYAALAYYHQHKAEIDVQMRRDAETAENLLAEFDAEGKLIRIE